MNILIEHTVTVTVEEHSEEQNHLDDVCTRLRINPGRERAFGHVTYRILAEDMDDVARICQEIGP